MLLGGGLPQDSIQADGTVSHLAQYESDPNLTEQQMSLLKEIAEQFSCEEAADLGILFEVTGFQGDTQSFDFWDNYNDFEEFGDTKLIKRGRNENKHELKLEIPNLEMPKIT